MKIKFLPSSKEAEYAVQQPIPAKKFIPDWYKNSPTFNKKSLSFREEDEKLKIDSVKMCMPFLDGMTFGYIQTTWCDIYIGNKDGHISYNYSGFPKLMEHREKPNIEVSERYYPIEFAWKQPWIPKTPPGYSVLITQPLNRLDLKTETLSGIIDSDEFSHTTNGNIPFYIENGFSGIIPSGTPMYQIIPFKRENWKSEKEEFNQALAIKKAGFMYSKFFDSYKNNFWKKKNYE